MKLALTFLFLLSTCFVLSGCTATAPQRVDSCLQYNQGTRVTANREWPAAVREAEKLKSKMRIESITIGMNGPAEFDRLAREFKIVLAPAIANAGSCYSGSLFQDIVIRMTQSISELDEKANSSRVRWKASERKRAERESAITQLPPDVRKQRLGDAEIEILAIRSNSRFTTIRLKLSNRSDGRIIRAITGKAWGYDEESPERGGIASVGFSLLDNFGNRFSLHQAKPQRLGAIEPGLHPKMSEEYEIVFSGYPPESASTISLVIWRGTFGNSDQHEIVLPRGAFLP